ncbi:MAG: hypothetical protein JRJ26_17910 [Deltaproteobacteria bacterium]|nr:hypothetical protein [Deltaproteobacteria bacterium]
MIASIAERKASWPLTGRRGTVLVELLVASAILVVVILGVSTLFLGNIRAFDRGKDQMELQRIGSLVMEGMTRALQEGSRVAGNYYDDTSGAFRAIQIFYPGEPFFDSNHNGVCDSGEDFIDLNGDGVWNPASGPEANAMPTVYFEFDTGNETIQKGTEEADSTPWDALTNDITRGSIRCDHLGFVISLDGRTVGIALTIRNDMNTGDQTDDLSMAFASSVNLRE